MIKKIRIHAILLILVYSNFMMFSLIYKRDFIDNSLGALAYIMLLIALVFTINLIKKRIMRWIIFVTLSFLPLSYLIFAGINYWDYSSIYLLEHAAPINVPFLPDILASHIGNQTSKIIIVYLLYFLLPICYWYTFYFISKKIDAYFSRKINK